MGIFKEKALKMATEKTPRKPRVTEAGSKAKLDRLAQWAEISIEVMESLPAADDIMKGQVTALRAVLAQIKRTDAK